ncbi:MAG: YvcK family protein [Candidatus Omnitrophota bacterium]|nr:YvcK family protein [Candidatus Omnitrophota bacterium]
MREKSFGILKWFYPGIGIKRWVGLSAFGVVLLILGTANLRSEEFWLIQILDALIVISGIIILILGIKRLMRSFIAIFVPSASRGTELIDILYQKKHLSRGPRIVTVGGGTGLSVLLSGLKNFTSNISAVVTVADNGGSSGRLRQQFDVLPPGDIRNCLVALADAPALMRDLFQFRFDEHSEFSGHSFGNLFLTVMTRLTGDFEKAIKETSKVLALRGQVIPSTLGDVTLVAHYADGSMVIGEAQIPRARKSISRVSLTPEQPLATPDALKAIKEAQIIVLGPGSLYTSIIPNLLIKEITQEIAESEAVKVYVCNVMTQPGETDGYSVSDHIKALFKHSDEQILDYCVVNNGEVPSEVLKRYSQDNSLLVVNDRKKVENLGVRVVEEDFSMIADGVIRHDAEKLAKIILSFIDEI